MKLTFTHEDLDTIAKILGAVRVAVKRRTKSAVDSREDRRAVDTYIAILKQHVEKKRYRKPKETNE